MRTAKSLIRLGGCPGWSEYWLVAHSLCLFCHVTAQVVIIKTVLIKSKPYWKSWKKLYGNHHQPMKNKYCVTECFLSFFFLFCFPFSNLSGLHVLQHDYLIIIPKSIFFLEWPTLSDKVRAVSCFPFSCFPNLFHCQVMSKITQYPRSWAFAMDSNTTDMPYMHGI